MAQPTPSGVLSESTERRGVPRIPFRATSVVAEAGSSRTVIAQTTELSRFGCFVQTAKSHPQGTRVLIEITDGGDVFTASGQVAYVTSEGMGVVFSMVGPESYDIWRSGWRARPDDPIATASLRLQKLRNSDHGTNTLRLPAT